MTTEYTLIALYKKKENRKEENSVLRNVSTILPFTIFFYLSEKCFSITKKKSKWNSKGL